LLSHTTTELPPAQGTFLPYGQEWNPQLTTNHYKFTGKERDAESGLDFFGARFYSSAMGRWMSPDWADKPEPVPYADLSDPQSLNLYGYVRNNPMSKADADGHCPQCALALEGAELGAEVGSLGGPIGSAIGGLIGGAGALLLGYELADAGSHLLQRSPDAPITIPNNPAKPGTLGQPDHQQTVKEEGKRVNGDTEVTIDTKGGKKDSRRADAVGTNPVTGQPQIVQVYRPTKTGRIPKREQEAAQDIQNATGIAPTMVPVRPLPPPPLPPIEPKPPQAGH